VSSMVIVALVAHCLRRHGWKKDLASRLNLTIKVAIINILLLKCSLEIGPVVRETAAVTKQSAM